VIDEDFCDYCRQCTDSQLEEVLRFEWQRFDHGDYDSARIVAAERGWTVHNGKRLS
jgi:hypothetical protein